MDVNKIIEEYYKSFKLTPYEKYCNFCYNILKIKLKDEELKEYEELNKFCKLRIHPAANISAAIITFLIGMILVLFFSFFIPSLTFILFILLILITFLTYYYPFLLAKFIRSNAASEMMHAIIYFVISLKQVPTLERATIFAASNLEGEIGKDLKEVVAKLYVGDIKNVKEGLEKVVERWYREAREFSEALKLIISYSENPTSEKLLDEALRLIHDETFSRLEKYSRSLKLPSSIILGLGIILPLLSIVVLFLFALFFPQIFSFSSLILIYNIFLPIILLIIISTLLSSRPLTSSYLLVQNPFKKKVFGYEVNILIIFLALSFLISLPLVFDFLEKNKIFELCAEWSTKKFSDLKKPTNLELSESECKNVLTDFINPIFSSVSLLLILVLPTCVFLFFMLKNIIFSRRKIERVEKEMPTVLYQIGYYINIGNPLEIAISKSIEKYKNFEVSKLFEKIYSKIITGFNLNEAIFGKDGAINFYPSTLIKSVFEVIVESYRKGYQFASRSMIILSQYLNSLFKLQDKIEEMISDTTNNLKFISTFLLPVITASGVSLGIILLSLVATISFKTPQAQETAIPTMPLPFLSLTTPNLYTGSIIFSIGLYVIEIVFISSFLIVGLEKGLEKYYILDYLAKNLAISIIFYCIAVIALTALLSPLIQSFLIISQ